MINSTVEDIQLDTIEAAIEDIAAGRIVIVVDDEDRENEGDFICAAEKITPDIINFMAKYGRGLICSPITLERAEELELNSMVSNNTDLFGTAFTVSIDYKKEGCTTGISTYDRATGIKALTSSETKSNDYARPGHIFPLIAKPGGVLRRTGHTEAAVDLAVLAGLKPAGVLVEILNEDGTMARLPELKVIAENFDFRIISIKDLVAYRMQRERLVKFESKMDFNTDFGSFQIHRFKETNNNLEHLAFVKGVWNDGDEVLTRVHSSNNASELLSFMMNSKNNEFYKTLELIEKEGKGVLLMLRKPDAPDALIDGLELIKHQVANNEEVNLFPQDADSKHRELGIGAQILRALNMSKLRLISKSKSRKRVGLIGYGLEIVENVNI